ncbi:MAG: hypothetical protein O3A20_08135 [Planctomycetota bacterium]|nr:hypothetical protein [Planctomycetota bacterium]
MRKPAVLLALLCAPLVVAAVDHAPQDPGKVAEFLKGWKAADDVGDESAQERLLLRYKEDALMLFVQRVDARSVRLDDNDLNAFCDRFIKVWAKTTNSSFARNYDRYLQLISADDRDRRNKYVGSDLPMVNRLHIIALNKSEEVDLAIARQQADILAENLYNVGDLYYAAFAHNIRGNLYNPRLFPADGDGGVALSAYESFLECRKQIDLSNDKAYADAERMWKELRFALGIIAPGEEDEAAAATFNPEAPTVKEGMDWISTELVFGSEKKLGSVIHSTDLADEFFHTWKRVNVSKVGDAAASVPGISPPISVEHLATDRFRLIAGDEPSKDFRLGSKPLEVEVMRMHPDGVVRPYRLLVAGGGSSDVIQGVQMNLQMQDEGGPLFFRSAATYSSETPYGDLTLYDANADGWFGYQEMTVTWTDGLLPDTWFYNPDAITLGNMKHSQPYTRFLRDDAANWYELRQDNFENPGKIDVVPVDVTLGKLRISIKGVKKIPLTSLILASDSSGTKGLVVDLAAWKGPEYSLPIGRYVFKQARFSDGKGDEILVLPHPTLPMAVDVGVEGVASLELGAPFTLVATAALDGNTVTVNGRALHVAGAAGERYVRIVGEPLFGVEVAIKGAKPSELKMPTTEEAGADWERLFYPMDAAIELKKADKPVIELLLKKHAWFGKISGEIRL